MGKQDRKKDYDQTWADLLNNEFGDNVLESIDLLSKPGLRLHGPEQKRAHRVVQSALTLARDVRFLHWELAFPTVWSGTNGGHAGGFDAVIGNPPWNVVDLQDIEWFAERRPDIALTPNSATRRSFIEKLRKEGDPLWDEYTAACSLVETAAKVVRESGDYPLLSSGKLNLYKLFVERATRLVNPNGLIGFLTPTGIASDKSASLFFRTITSQSRLKTLFDFENRSGFFPDVDARFKFLVIVIGGEKRQFDNIRYAFYLQKVEDLAATSKLLKLSSKDFLAVNPNTGVAPIFRSARDADITARIYRDFPIFSKQDGQFKKKVWPVRYVQGLFNISSDAEKFMRRRDLESEGWYPVENQAWQRGTDMAIRLFEGKMVQMFDHRAAGVLVNTENLFRAAQEVPVGLHHHQDPKFILEPQYWINGTEAPQARAIPGSLVFKDVTSPTNMRTVIGCIIPTAATGHTLPILLPEEAVNIQDYSRFIPLILANLNCFALDFFARQKVQGQHLLLHILEQLPMIQPERFETKLGKHKIADFVRGEVLRLTYTAHDLEPFARDLGYDGPPFMWDEDDRRHRRARLDALFFQLYGISRDDATYILDTFPIVREQDEKAFGRYLTKELVLAYMNAIAAGDITTVVKV